MNNILISSAGRRVSLVREFQKELKKVYPKSKVLVVDLNPDYSSACRVADSYFKICRVTDANYIDELLKICLDNNVGIVVPTIDTELLVLAENKEKFRKNGIEIIVSNRDFILKCRDKRLIHQFFKEQNIDVAKEIDRKNLSFPFFAKPYDGSCSQGLYFVKDKASLNQEILDNESLMFLEYINPKEHDEYTLDLYYDKKSELKSVVPRLRIEVRSGEINKGITVKNFLVKYVQERLANVESLYGCITFQAFVNKTTQRVVGIEINPRFGGGYPLSYNAGANFPKMIIDEYILNKSIDYSDAWEDNLLMLRYDDEILVKNVD